MDKRPRHCDCDEQDMHCSHTIYIQNFKRCVLCDKPMSPDYDHVTCQACVDEGKLEE